MSFFVSKDVLFPFSWLCSKARSRCTRGTFGWMNSVRAFSWLSGGGARGVAWRRSFERVRACRCRNGGETQRSCTSDVRERIPEVRRYLCPINDYMWPFGSQAWIFFLLTTPQACLLFDGIRVDWDTFFLVIPIHPNHHSVCSLLSLWWQQQGLYLAKRMACFETPSKLPRGHASQSSAALISSASLLYQESDLFHQVHRKCLHCLSFKGAFGIY